MGLVSKAKLKSTQQGALLPNFHLYKWFEQKHPRFPPKIRISVKTSSPIARRCFTVSYKLNFSSAGDQNTVSSLRVFNEKPALSRRFFMSRHHRFPSESWNTFLITLPFVETSFDLLFLQVNSTGKNVNLTKKGKKIQGRMLQFVQIRIRYLHA